MVTCYPKEYLEKYEVLEEGWSDSKYPDAKKIRDRRARELRKQGWEVKCVTYDFTDLARSMRYCLDARRLRNKEVNKNV